MLEIKWDKDAENPIHITASMNNMLELENDLLNMSRQLVIGLSSLLAEDSAEKLDIAHIIQKIVSDGMQDAIDDELSQ
jgi:hypothetical protein